MSNKQKNKGKAYERALCVFLKEVTGLNFERIPNSGAFIGGKNQHRTDNLTTEQLLLADGDIIVPTEWKHISIECKSYKSLSWSKIYTEKGDSELNTWIEQAKETIKPFWFLCFKINNQGQYVVFSSELESSFCLGNSYTVYQCDYIICELTNFFKNNKKIISQLKS